MKFASIALGAAAAIASVNAAPSHPTLPWSWTAQVREAEVGFVDESYNMVYKPTLDNISGKWTNFTDGSCQRLIYVPDLPSAARYLMLCDAVDCCKEEQSGNHIEYQINNVHPPELAPVKSLGKEKIGRTAPNGTYITTECDVWNWEFATEKFYVYTTPSSVEGEAQLHQWTVHIEGRNFTNYYFDYKGIPATDYKDFERSFEIPPQCRAKNILRCDDAVKKGLLSEKRYKEFVAPEMPGMQIGGKRL